MNWAQERRCDFIAWRLQSVGAIRRGDIMETFGVSQGQASADLNEFIGLYPDAIAYDKSAKQYVPADRRRRPREVNEHLQAYFAEAAE